MMDVNTKPTCDAVQPADFLADVNQGEEQIMADEDTHCSVAQRNTQISESDLNLLVQKAKEMVENKR